MQCSKWLTLANVKLINVRRKCTLFHYILGRLQRMDYRTEKLVPKNKGWHAANKDREQAGFLNVRILPDQNARYLQLIERG